SHWEYAPKPRPVVAACPVRSWSASRLQRLGYQRLHAAYLAVEPPLRPLAIVHLDRTADPVAIRSQGFVTALHDGEHRFPLAFEDGAHCVQAVIQAARRDDLQAAGNIRTHTLALTQGRHAEFE